MSKFEAELRLPCKQPYAYISVWIRGETVTELYGNLVDFQVADMDEKLHLAHSQAYDVVMGVTKKATPEQLITSELGGKVIEEVTNTKPDDSMKAYDVKPWERKKPAAPKAADPNDPFANFK